MLWEPPTLLYADPIKRGIGGQHLVPYGRKHRYYAHMSGLGQGGMIPTGAVLLYTGTWEINLYMATDPTGSTPNTPDAVLSAVLGQTIPGMQVVGQQVTGTTGILTWTGAPQTFQVKISLQVTGPGFAQASDAKSIIDGLYYQVVGTMPTSSIYVQSVPSAPPAPGVPTTPGPTGYPTLPGPALPPGTIPPPQTGAPPPPGSQTFTQWLEQNAAMIGMVVIAAMVLPSVVKKL